MALERHPTHASLICYLDYKIFISQCQVQKSQYFAKNSALNPHEHWIFAVLEAFALKYWQGWQFPANRRFSRCPSLIIPAGQAGRHTDKRARRRGKPRRCHRAPRPFSLDSAGT